MNQVQNVLLFGASLHKFIPQYLNICWPIEGTIENHFQSILLNNFIYEEIEILMRLIDDLRLKKIIEVKLWFNICQNLLWIALRNVWICILFDRVYFSIPRDIFESSALPSWVVSNFNEARIFTVSMTYWLPWQSFILILMLVKVVFKVIFVHFLSVLEWFPCLFKFLNFLLIYVGRIQLLIKPCIFSSQIRQFKF